ncbi:MAG: serine/threonine-protein phosphatase [Acidobacteria bacterium]|nr:serine/threonine-protein phosphatase [Acidobacteriota bacterium]
MLDASAVSDVGRVRKTNEDAFVADLDVSLFCVADGMGGHDAGEVASALAIEAISAFIRRSAADTDFSWPYGIDRSLSYDANRLRTAVHLANRRIFRTAENNDDYNGMGTTIVGALINGTRMAIAHVGDSRLYLIRKGRIRQLTADDSWAATILAHDPRLNPADIARHPMRNVLTNVLGARDQVDVHVSEHDLEPGDLVLLCSDGLHGVVDDAALAEIAGGQTDLKLATRRMVDTALERGSRDNVTALLVRVSGAAA